MNRKTFVELYDLQLEQLGRVLTLELEYQRSPTPYLAGLVETARRDLRTISVELASRELDAEDLLKRFKAQK